MHFPELSQVVFLGGAAIDTDGRWVRSWVVHDDPPEVAVFVGMGEEDIDPALGVE